jgi:hypothetical protein
MDQGSVNKRADMGMDGQLPNAMLPTGLCPGNSPTFEGVRQVDTMVSMCRHFKGSGAPGHRDPVQSLPYRPSL